MPPSCSSGSRRCARPKRIFLSFGSRLVEVERVSAGESDDCLDKKGSSARG